MADCWKAPEAFKRAVKAAAIAMLLGAFGPASAQDPPTKATKAVAEAADANPVDTAALSKLLVGLPQVTFNDQGTVRRFYVWDGDMLLDRDEVQAMLLARRARQGPLREGELLLQIRDDGKPGVWRRGHRTLSWAIDCSTFSSGRCLDAETAFKKAAQDWQRLCPACAIKFVKAAATAGRIPSDSSGPSFVIRFNPAATDYLAVSFFANDPAYKRYVEIGPGFFTTTISHDGILRHELGHVLGYRHEHNLAPAGCYFEDNQWKPLTAYDPKSVMHYLCGGGGTRQLDFTKSDKEGHQIAYGG